MSLSWLCLDERHLCHLDKPPSITSSLHPMILPSPEPRPYSVRKVAPWLSLLILSPTKTWLVARLRKHLQTAWDLVSQTRLWHSGCLTFIYMRNLSNAMSESSHGENTESVDQQVELSTLHGKLGSNCGESILYEATDHDEVTTINWRDRRLSVTQTGGIALAMVKKFGSNLSMQIVQASSQVCSFAFLQSRPLPLLVSSHPHPSARVLCPSRVTQDGSD